MVRDGVVAVVRRAAGFRLAAAGLRFAAAGLRLAAAGFLEAVVVEVVVEVLVFSAIWLYPCPFGSGS